jgi:hypothetical protein
MVALKERKIYPLDIVKFAEKKYQEIPNKEKKE